MGVIPKEKKKKVLVEIGKILDKHCNECEMYLNNIEKYGQKYAIKFCRRKCQIGKKMHRLAESISPNVPIEDQEIDDQEFFVEVKPVKKYKKGEITKEWILEKLNSGLTYDEIALEINRTRKLISYYVKKYGIVRRIREDGKIYYESI